MGFGWARWTDRPCADLLWLSPFVDIAGLQQKGGGRLRDYVCCISLIAKIYIPSSVGLGPRFHDVKFKKILIFVTSLVRNNILYYSIQ